MLYYCSYTQSFNGNFGQKNSSPKKTLTKELYLAFIPKKINYLFNANLFFPLLDGVLDRWWTPSSPTTALTPPSSSQVTILPFHSHDSTQRLIMMDTHDVTKCYHLNDNFHSLLFHSCSGLDMPVTVQLRIPHPFSHSRPQKTSSSSSSVVIVVVHPWMTKHNS